MYYVEKLLVIYTGSQQQPNIQGGPKILAHFCTSYNYQILTNFQIFFTVRIRKKCVIVLSITKDPTTPQMCRYTTLWNVNVLNQQLKTRLL